MANQFVPAPLNLLLAKLCLLASLLSLFSGCTYEIENGDDMRRNPYAAYPPVMGRPDPPIIPKVTPPNPMQWGSQRIINPNEWQEGNPIPINSLDKASANWRVPYTQALVLASTIPADVTGNFALRWQLQFGAGGGSTIILLDAGGVQQVTIPAEQLRVSMLAEKLGPDAAFNPPDKPVTAVCFFADGTTATDPPTYTTRFDVEGGQTETYAAPPGATAFRIAGNAGSVATPFTANVRYDVMLPSSVVMDRYTGDYILDIRYTDFPFSGQAVALQITASGMANASGYIEWIIDL